MSIFKEIQLASVDKPVTAWWLLFLSLAVLAIATKIFYNVYLHPLAKFPGPTLYAASPFPVAFAQLNGTYHLFTHKAHEQYGNVVRISPNELSFISPAAWNDIYARHNGSPPLPRDKTFFNDMLVDKQTLTMADTENHARLRKAMNPAFSPRALALQEPILQKNVDLFLHQLQKHATQGQQLDLRLWYNYITFDLIGDLAFGESFGCLEASSYHEWVQFVVDYFYIATLLQVVHRFRPLNKLLATLIPSSLIKQKEDHGKLTAEKVKRRMKRRIDRLDFVHPLIEARDSGIITNDEVEQQASILILAGGETSSIALTSATYLLLQHPGKMDKLVNELHANFQHEHDIDVSSISKLVYLQAVIQETLRLFPPITNGFPRETNASGAVIDGLLIPEKTVVNVSHWSAYHSESNFTRPAEFLPERWLGVDAQFNKDAKDVFQPFSVGPQSCIGKKFAFDNMKLILARTLWRFDIEISPDSRRRYSDEQRAYVSFHQPPLLVNLTLRQGKAD
ncbi:uncharacterized protein N7469_001251 [Penicillium citrinum]|uniref:Uncharacterized protein n=1 Tax=Penicillium citrinum TaxID=5077 RepID=A0A9W9PGJ7_PENCI|nr:uncharacterized protein N7469_001251 [Penicillium citrinum]KAJ5242924.1 hypothetical protein N7469_001251 [Penicillium citrinum]